MKSTDLKYRICKNARRFCKEDISLIENYAAMMADTSQVWCCHHRREIDEHKSKKQLIAEGQYYNRPAYELIFMTVSDHMKLHMLGKHHSEEAKKNISELMKGKNLGRRWFNNGVKNVFCKECPEGFVPGCLRKRNKPDSYESGQSAAE